MIIAISAVGPGLDAEVDPRFGRCRCFVIVDPATLEYEDMENSGPSADGGAGIAAAQAVAGKGVAAVLTGNCGPNAFEALSAAGIQVITGVSGRVRDAMAGYKEGKYQPSTEASVRPHSGMGGS